MCHGRECVLFHFLECEISPLGIIKACDLSVPTIEKKVVLVANCTTFLGVGNGKDDAFFHLLVTLFVTSKLSV